MKSTNLIRALINIMNNPTSDIKKIYKFTNRANNMGEALEYYIKDIFCDTLNVEDLAKKNETYSKYFSYLGNQNNPPDLIIRNGDAIEIKKIESVRSGIALNSSYPKDKLYSDSPMITVACRDCERWSQKDIIYAIGLVKDDQLKSLWFIYGDCYAASKAIYERIKDRISQGLYELDGVEFSETKELGRVNKVDPLGITYLRIRGMWHIENPIKVFDYLTEVNKTDNLSINVIMTDEKYSSFSDAEIKQLNDIGNDNLTIKDIKLRSPNNPAKLINSKLINIKF